MKPSALTTLVLSAVLILFGCAAGGNGNPDDGGQPNPYNGRLVASGNSYLHSMNLTANGTWQRQINLPPQYAYPSVRPDLNTLYVATLNALEPLFVKLYDLSTFGNKGEDYTWPDTENLIRINEFAAAPGGRYLAVNMRGFDDNFLEIFDTDTLQVVFSGFGGVVESNMVWTSDLDLVFAMNFQGQGPEGIYGGIVAIALEEFERDDDNFDIRVLQGFTQAQYSGIVYDIALSHDETQIAYSRSGDIWAKNLTTGEDPRQLTTGPTPSWGPAFSPDGNHIAFVGARGSNLRDTMVVKNDGGGPYMVNTEDHSVSEVDLIDRRDLVSHILAWMP